MKEIEAAYIARKSSQGVEVPKYLKITEIDMNRDTFKKVLMLPKILSEAQINEFIANGQLHNQKCEQLKSLKKNIDS